MSRSGLLEAVEEEEERGRRRYHEPCHGRTEVMGNATDNNEQ